MISGMDVNQLRHELTQGIRLPKPEMCPDNIADIIQRCFRKHPNERPDFKEITTLIESAYDALISFHNTSDAPNPESEKLLYENISSLRPSKSDKMKERYLDMRRTNKKGFKGDHGRVDGDVGEKDESFELRSKRHEYLSLDNVYSSASMVPLHGSGENFTRGSDARSSLLSSNYRPDSIISNKYKQLSPGSNEMKSFFSSSAVNTISATLEPSDLNRKISQSWNPLYYTVSPDLNLIEPSTSNEISLTDAQVTDSLDSPRSSKPIIKNWFEV